MLDVPNGNSIFVSIMDSCQASFVNLESTGVIVCSGLRRPSVGECVVYINVDAADNHPPPLET